VWDFTVASTGSKQLCVSKGAIAGVHGCEANCLVTRDDFAWSMRSPRAIELRWNAPGDKTEITYV
jgi:hypothetical protein